MEKQNPENDFIPSKNQTIEEYINENLQLKTLKIKKFSFQNSISSQAKSSRNLRNSQTARQIFNSSQQRYDSNISAWGPKLSYRKILKEPKIMLSVERRKIKSSQGLKKVTPFISAPQSRLGFKGEKVKSQSFYIQKTEEKMPKKLVIDCKSSTSQKKYKRIPNFHFNLQYVIQQRKKGRDQLSIQEMTKQGSNKGYFAFFGSENFTKYLQKNLNHSSRKHMNKAEERKQQARNKKPLETNNL